MASLTESSIASIPYEKLIELKRQLTGLPQQSRGSAHSETFHQAATKAAKGSSYGDGTDNDIVVLKSSSISPGRVIHTTHGTASAVNRWNSRASSHQRSNKSPPRLLVTKSAPGGREMETMVQEPPSQEVFNTLTRGVSFHGYPGGDTQPMESQVYRQYHESISKSNQTTPQKVRITGNGELERREDTTREATLGTLQDGDTGFVNLTFQPRSPSPESQDEAEYEEQLVSSQLGSQKEVSHFQTPAIAGNKHSRDGRILFSEPPTTISKPPDFSHFFSNSNAPVMSATQLFNQTQAPSSPLPDFPRSDPIITRPSPNVRTAGMTSPPPVTTSSPVFGMHHMKPSPLPGEPRSTYMSMKESQERRRLRSSAGSGPQDAIQNGDYNVDEFDLMIGPVRRGLQRVTSDPVVQERAEMRLPQLQSSRSDSPIKERPTIDLVTPLATIKRPGARFKSNLNRENSDNDDINFNTESGIDEGEDEDEEINDVYDELSGSIMKSQVDRSDDLDEDLSADGEELSSIVQGEERDEEGFDTETPLVQHSSLQREIYLGSVTGDAATQHTTVANSVPGTPQRHIYDQKRIHHDPPSTVSIIPGSQYAGRPSTVTHRLLNSQEQPLENQRNSSTLGKRRPNQAPKMPSSPPQVFIDDNVPDDSAEASIARRQALTKSQALSQQQATSFRETEIPESDAVCKENAEHAPCVSSQSKHSGHHSPVKPSQSQRSRMTDDTPRKAAGIPHFKDLTNSHRVPALSKDPSMDLDSILGDVFTAEDQQVIAATSSPPRLSKPRRLEPQPSRRRAPTTFTEMSEETPPDVETNAPEPIAPNQSSLRLVNETNDLGQAIKEITVLRDNPAIANEILSGTPPVIENQKSETPESVRLREVAGAQAVSQLLSTRSRKRAQPKSIRDTGSLKKPKRKRPVINSSGEMENTLDQQQLADTEQSYHTARTNQNQNLADVELTNKPAEQTPHEIAHNDSQDVDAVLVDAIAPTRVFAHFGGRYNNYYPSTWLSSSLDGCSHKVRFDDNAITVLPVHAVRRLELRPGDQVKVDVKGMRNNVWLVRGFANQIANEDQHGNYVDIHGFRTVKVQAKASRSSVGGAVGPEDGEGEGEGDIIDVALQAIYLTPSLWHKFDRDFAPPSEYVAPNIERLSTPASELKTPVETPSSRYRRPNSVLPISRSHLREGSVASSTSFATSGLFSGMIFAISYSSNDAEKEQVTRLIKQNGGIILESGFDELFVQPHFSKGTSTSPSKRQNADVEELKDESAVLQIQQDFIDVGFAALIADRHSRRAKYMQALALGLPTLSGRWIIDSISAATVHLQKNDSPKPLAWFRYLLASGESAYLSGAVRSRTIVPYAATESKLSSIISNREILLHGDGVLIVAPKRGKQTWEKTKAYAFLTLAIGAGKVKLTNDLQEARALTHTGDGKWRWVYVDGTIAEAQAEFFGKQADRKATGQATKKRKRNNTIDRDVNSASALSAGDGNVRIVNDEFVVQSLILGALVE